MSSSQDSSSSSILDNGVVIGVDGGGTKTVVTILSLKEPRQFLSTASGGSTNQNSVGKEAAQRVISSTIQSALSSANVSLNQVRGVCLGMSGVDRESDKLLVQSWIAEIFNGLETPVVKIYNDAVVALSSGTEGRLFGVVVISGTGTISFGYNDKGETCRAGGWGPLLGDEGSGYAVGSDLLKAVANANDGTRPSTLLTESLLSHLKLTKTEDLIGWAYADLSWERIASLYHLVEEAFYKNDSVAISIIDKAVEGLFATIAAVIEKLGLANASSFPVVFSGGVLTHDGSAIAPKLTQKIKEKYPMASVTFPKVKAEQAAALLVAHNNF